MFELRLGPFNGRVFRGEGLTGSSFRASGSEMGGGGDVGAIAGMSRESSEFCGTSKFPCAPSVGKVGEPGIRLLWDGAPEFVRGGNKGDP